jgi:hypothetical protein
MRHRPLPPMLTGIVQTAIQLCDGTEYFARGTCRSCGGTLSGYDTRTKRFATLSDEEGEHPVEVILHRAYCRTCGKIITPEEPFYPGTRAGSPVVDLCLALGGTMPGGRVATRLGQMGVKVSRWSVMEYRKGIFPVVPTVAAFGMMIPISIISLSSLATTLHNTGRVDGEDILAACNHPSLNRQVP